MARALNFNVVEPLAPTRSHYPPFSSNRIDEVRSDWVHSFAIQTDCHPNPEGTTDLKGGERTLHPLVYGKNGAVHSPSQIFSQVITSVAGRKTLAAPSLVTAEIVRRTVRSQPRAGANPEMLRARAAKPCQSCGSHVQKPQCCESEQFFPLPVTSLHDFTRS